MLSSALVLIIVLLSMHVQGSLHLPIGIRGLERLSSPGRLFFNGNRLAGVIGEWLRVDFIEGQAMLAQTLPAAAEVAHEQPPSLSWQERLRSWVYIAMDLDITQPTTYLAAVLPASHGNTTVVRLPGARPMTDPMPTGEHSLDPPLDLPEHSRLDDAVWGDDRIAGALADVNFATSSRLSALAQVAWGNDPLVLILHTHSSEMYVSSDFTPASSQTSHRFNAVDTGVIRVGEVMAKTLSHRYGIPVVHSKEIHDFPSHTLAYSNAAVTIRSLLAKYPSIKIVLDVHRDAAEGVSYVRSVNGTSAAQVMLVVSELGKTKPALHPNWAKNVQFAQAMQMTMEALYPGLYRSYPLVSARYNQHLHPNMVLLEVGNYEDDEKYALRSAAMMADVIAVMLEWTQGKPLGIAPEVQVTTAAAQPKPMPQPTQGVQPVPLEVDDPVPLSPPAQTVSPGKAGQTPLRPVDPPRMPPPNPTVKRP